ncbi:substrate-binding domain-containing protein [Streptomyces diastatochromogenes]|uniref:substrate-binding domain-containing protein n=1 Tax=Streptomyces diastatochromogenes TaxID=42236 RepID=UPI003669F0FE
MPRVRLSLAALSLASVSALLLSACSQSSDASQQTGDTTASASAATGKKPAPFSKGPVKVALVRQSGAGDYFEQWGNGAKAQAKALGIDLTVYDAQADNAKQATDLSSAVNSGARAIVIDHGFPATLKSQIDQAVRKGIKVVVYDLDVDNESVVRTEQDDASMAQAVNSPSSAATRS